MWKKENFLKKWPLDRNILFLVGALKAESIPTGKPIPVTFLNNGNGNNSSQHLQNTFYMLYVHYLT